MPRIAAKAAALRLGFAATRNEFVIVQDADLEYDPQDYAPVLRAAEGWPRRYGLWLALSRRAASRDVLLALPRQSAC